MKYKSTFCLVFCFFLMQMSWSQTINITGKILDETGEPLLGANIIVAGTANGVTSDFDGNYSITTDANSELIFSYIGYIDKKVKVNGKTVIDITLAPDVEIIEPVVVVGYGTQKIKNVVGAISTVKGKDLVETGVTNLSQIIQDRLPGVVTELGTGQPGVDDVKITIRGASSFQGDNAPLVLVDGIEVAGGFSQIDPGEIASFSILKDAASTAVYGVRGADGVILITTKRGRLGKPKITVNGGLVVKQVATKPNQLGSYDVLSLGQEAIKNSGNFSLINSQRYIDIFNDPTRDQYKYPDVDWYDELIADFGIETNARINISGGTDFVKYFTSFSANHVGDVLKNEDFNGYYDPKFNYDKINFRTNLDFNITKTTKLRLNVSGRSDVIRQPDSNFDASGVNDEIFLYTDQATPYFFPVFYPAEFVQANPDPLAPGDTERRLISTLRSIPFQKNPFTLLNYTGLRRTRRDVLDFQIAFTQDLSAITEGLKFSARYSRSSNFAFRKIERWVVDQWLFDAQSNSWSPQRQDQNYGRTDLDFRSGGGESFVSGNRNLYYEAKINYNRTFDENHNVAFTGVFNRTERRPNVSAAPFLSEDWVGRLSYNYDQRYLFEVSAGYNGSEKFIRGSRFGLFPSAAVGWNIAEESFVQDNISWLNKLKIRYSYGQTGNDKNSPRFLFLGGYSAIDPTLTFYRFGFPLSRNSAKIPRFGETKIANPNAQWEDSFSHNLGFDIALFDNDLNFELNFFKQERKGILLATQAPTYFNPSFGNPISGGRVSLPIINLGETKNQGMEFVANYSHTTEGGFTYSVGGNFTITDSRVINQGDLPLTPDYLKNEGKPIGKIFAYNTNGFINNFEEAINSPEVTGGNAPGRYSYVDFNGDGVINQNDRQVQEETNQPFIFYGFNTKLSYKKFDLSLRFLGKGGVSYVATRFYPNFNQYLFEAKDFHLDRWTPDNKDARFPAYTNTQSTQFYRQATDRNVVDSSYLKLQSVTLGYTLNSPYLKNLLRIQTVRFNLSGQNLFTWHNLPTTGDPEGGNGSAGPGIYPLVRRFIFSLNIDF